MVFVVLSLAGYGFYWRAVRPAGLPVVSETAAYVVAPGDTLSSIAARYHVSVGALAAANGIADPNLVTSGTHLTIPVDQTLGSLPSIHPEAQRVIVADANAEGVPPAFALAVSWEESGFNQSIVSPTGAIGVMQVEPGTGVTEAGILGQPIRLHDLHDNALAGVALLAQLLTMYHGDERSAAAAYYQGAASVARHGLYDDTRQYVANVMALEARFTG